MSRARRAFVIIVASLTVVIVGWVGFVGALLAWGGVATIRYAEDGGSNLTVPVPMAMVEVVAASGDVLFDAEDFDLDADLGDWAPVAREILSILDECPDAVLVDVQDGRESVRVEKTGRAIVVSIKDRDVQLEIRVPTRSARRIVESLTG